MILDTSSIETPSQSASFYIGHVRNGVVVLDANASSLSEGQIVRVEPVKETTTSLDRERAERLNQMRSLFEQWTDEDAQLLPEDADRLHSALEALGRLSATWKADSRRGGS